MSANEFLLTAIYLRDSGADEHLRSCISRAYYSMYHSAKPLADAHFPDSSVNRPMGVHERLSKRFKASPDPRAQGVGYALEEMKRQRCSADYDLDRPITQRQADSALKCARSFKSLLDACTPHSEQAADCARE